MHAITMAVHELAALSVRVLSPADPRIVAAQGEFLFVASDPVRSVRLVQDRHLESIRAANFLWLVCPDGYVGQSASMEIGYAVSQGVTIYATRAPIDLTLRHYVNVVSSISEVVSALRHNPPTRQVPGILIDPHASVEKAHHILDRIETALTRPRDFKNPPNHVHLKIADLQKTLTLPTYA
jgi:hypothetical protein